MHLNLRNTRTAPQSCVFRSTFYIASWYWLRDLATKYQNLIPLEKRFCQATNNNDNNDSNEEDDNDNIKHTLDR